MKNKNYKVALYYTFCDYLFLTYDIDNKIEKYKNILLNSEFVPYFLGILDTINESGGYPEIAINNIQIIIEFLKYNLKNEVDISNLEKIDINSFLISDKKYYNEIRIKKNSLLEYNKNVAIKEKDILESLECDFLTVLSLKTEANDYINTYVPYFILNKKYIYSINKILYMFPDLLLNFEFKKRIEYVLNANKKILKSKDIDAVKLYIKQNSLKYKKNKRYLNELSCIEEANMNTLIGINNINIPAFNLNDLQIYHHYLLIEAYLNGFSNKIDDIQLSEVFCYIANLTQIYKSDKERLINLLAIKKENLKGAELETYNYYLKKVNSLTILSGSKKINTFVKRCSKLEYLKIIFKLSCGDIKDFYDVADSSKNDLRFFETLIQSDSNFDKNIMLFNFKEILYSLKKYMDEYPSLFTNYIVRNRVENLLKKYQKEHTSKYLSKQLSKIKKV